MRVLIVGAAGFVGRHLVAECAGHGDDVTGTYLAEATAGAPDDAGLSWLPLDLLDEGSIDRALETARPEGIVHVAGQANVSAAAADPIAAFRVNAEGTVRLLNSAQRHVPGARVLVVTSAEVYGAVPAEELPVTEDRPLAPRTPYGVGKAAADFAAEQAWVVRRQPVIRMRPFNHVGPGQRPGFVVPDFARQIAAIERGVRPAVLEVGNLSARRDFTDVRDIARGYRLALERGRPGAAYNLCSGRSWAIEEIVRELLGQARREIEVRRDPARMRPSEVPEFRGDSTRAHEEFGWEPRIDLARSLAEVLDEWREASASPAAGRTAD
ncbi:MAG: GDP-mannose 4,6-dehydratase [Gemmatimonadetes bacterium]|nr:GDP-mannose 4,6-dehydratase [Gemmatimonadota bacterium]